jgi:PBP1b-binding outer membrane lipoprotein LpoB
MTRVAGLLLVVLLLAGCGQGEPTAMNHDFEQVDFQISTLETINSMYNQQHFAQLTHKYIALVHQYSDELGKDESRRRLVQLGDELSSYCLPCTGVLYLEARKF